MPGFVAKNPFIDHECARLGQPGADSEIQETYGQCNEDLIVESLLRVHLARSGRPMSQVGYVEIGAHHPITHSATYLFYRKYGARGLLVEPNPTLVRQLLALRPGDRVIEAVVSGRADPTATLHLARRTTLSSVDRNHMALFGDGEIVGEITVANLQINALFEAEAPQPFDFLSVDTEGVDLEILTALDHRRFSPAFVQCEPSGDAKPFIDMMKSRNYVPVAATAVNLVFANLLSLIGLPG